MLGGLSVEELIALRLQLIYAAQKVQTAFVAVISQEQQERNSRIYTAEQLKSTKLEIQHADLMLRGSVKNILPALEALAQEAVTT